MSNREIDEGEVQNNADREIQNQAGEPEVPTPVMANPTGVGVFFWMLTLIGTRIGGGIVGIPYASQQIGFITSLWIQIVYSWVAVFSSFLLLKVREITGESSLSNIGFFWYGRISIFFINALTALTQLGFPIIFFIVFGDVAGGLIEKVNSSGISFWSSRWFTHTILAAAIFYLVLKKEIHQLKYAGFGLILLIWIFIILFFIHYLTSNPHPSPQADLVETKLGIKFLSLLPTLATSYAIHPSFFTAFLSLKYKTTKNGTKTSMISIGILFTVYTISPLISYGLYGANIKSNMLKNVVEDTGVLPVILWFIYMMIAVIHIPIIFFIGKEAVLIFFDEATRRSYSKTREDDQAPVKSNIESEAPAQLSNQEHEDEKDEQNDQPEDEHSKIIGRDQNNNNERSPTDKVNEADLKSRQTFNPISAEANSLQYWRNPFVEFLNKS